MQNVKPFKTMKTIQISHFDFSNNCRILKKVVCTHDHSINQKILNVATNGTYDYIAQTRRTIIIRSADKITWHCSFAHRFVCLGSEESSFQNSTKNGTLVTRICWKTMMTIGNLLLLFFNLTTSDLALSNIQYRWEV